jgi:hypothetical protein
MKHLLAVLLCLLGSVCSAKLVADTPLEFSIVMPDGTKVETQQNEKGRVVTAVYQNQTTHEAFSVQAVRANNGGFNAPQASVFKSLVEGTSNTLGKHPSLPLRTLPYGQFELHVAQHTGVGVARTQTLTTVVFLQELGAWRKVITVQFLTNEPREPTDQQIVQRLQEAKFRPGA